ncbi:hypothetical protein [Croceimicrobium hydrocarbonivorans]|uniref:Uncharacterized protein n=1 Tax=Croceimicrobium hydrocarbonivorans TaxID=2761580 RepID=A0A7H0VID7_9FLAO|nr:hypothetical protein [Croceimicrobium hydrocarbonivorans]QNR25485.1 hypothetical protein H4K34_06490 [Croceimicrobium hydrocarbonivorans]
MVDTGLYLTYVLIGVCVIGILGFSVLNIAKNPGGAKSALVGIVGLIVIFGLTYALSDGTDATTTYAKLDITEGTSSRIGMGLGTFYVLTAAAIVAILYSEVSRLFSK